LCLGLLVALTLSIFFGMKALRLDNGLTKTTAKSQSTYHFVLIPEEMDNDYWRLVEKGARAAEKDFGVTVEYTGPEKADTEQHIKSIDMAIAAKADGIITQGLNEEAFDPMINKAMKKGIPVVTVDTDSPTSERIAYVGTDNYYAGVLAGEALIQDTHGKATVGIITGRFDAAHQRLRVQGFRDTIKNAPGIKIVAEEESNITRIGAAEKTNKILDEHPDVTAFYGTSALDAIGISQVAEKRHLTHSLYIIGFDTLPETLNLIKTGKIDATVTQEPYEMGYKSVELMLDIVKKKKVPEVTNTKTSVLHLKDLLNKGDVPGP